MAKGSILSWYLAGTVVGQNLSSWYPQSPSSFDGYWRDLWVAFESAVVFMYLRRQVDGESQPGVGGKD